MSSAPVIKVIAIPYRTFKEKIKFTKRFRNEYRIQDLDGVLYMERKRFK